MEPETKAMSDSMHEAIMTLRQAEKNAQSRISEARKKADEMITEAKVRAGTVYWKTMRAPKLKSGRRR